MVITIPLLLQMHFWTTRTSLFFLHLGTNVDLTKQNISSNKWEQNQSIEKGNVCVEPRDDITFKKNLAINSVILENHDGCVCIVFLYVCARARACVIMHACVSVSMHPWVCQSALVWIWADKLVAGADCPLGPICWGCCSTESREIRYEMHPSEQPFRGEHSTGLH